MRHTFTLDENIAVCATTRRNVRGESDSTSFQLVNQIVSGIHRLAWSIEVYARWSEKVQWVRDRNEAIEPTFFNTISLAMVDSEKWTQPETGNPAPLPDENDWSTKLLDDAPFIRLAAHFQSLLATTDEPLQRDTRKFGLEEKYSFRTLLESEALEHAMDTTP